MLLRMPSDQTSGERAPRSAAPANDRAMRERWEKRLQPLLLLAEAATDAPHADTESTAGRSDRDAVATACALAGVTLVVCRDGAEALLQAGRLSPDVVIVNARLGLVTAPDVIATLHTHLTARIAVAVDDGQTEALAPALLAGATDVLTRPYQQRQLAALLRAHAAGPADIPQRHDVVTAGPLILDSAAFDVTLSGRRLKLTFREFELLRYLMLNVNRVVSQDELRQNVWRAQAQDMSSNTIAVNIRRLRAPLQGSVEIRAVRNRGYQLVIDDDRAG